jgi:hypothetical protein
MAASKMHARDHPAHAQKVHRNLRPPQLVTTTTTATLTTAASKTQFPTKDQVDETKDMLASDIVKGARQTKNTLKSNIKPDLKDDPKQTNKRTKN